MPEKVSVVVATYGKHDYCASCLESIRQQSYSYLEVSLIDNSPVHSPVVSLQQDWPALKRHRSSGNLFFCEAMNVGIRMSTGEYVLCMNDDVVLEKDFIEKVLCGFSADRRVGIVGGKMLREDRKTVDSAGLSLTPWRTAQDRGYGGLDRGQFEKEQYVFGICGAAVLFRRQMLEEIKEDRDYFDPSFRIFYEDLDIAWRAQRRGWRARYVPAAVAYHARGGSIRSEGGPGQDFARRYLSHDIYANLIINRYRMIIKNETCPGAILCFLPCLLYDVLTYVYLVLFRREALRQVLSSRGWLSEAMRKRVCRKKIPRSEFPQ